MKSFKIRASINNLRFLRDSMDRLIKLHGSLVDLKIGYPELDFPLPKELFVEYESLPGPNRTEGILIIANPENYSSDILEIDVE